MRRYLYGGSHDLLGQGINISANGLNELWCRHAAWRIRMHKVLASHSSPPFLRTGPHSYNQGSQGMPLIYLFWVIKEYLHAIWGKESIYIMYISIYNWQFIIFRWVLVFTLTTRIRVFTDTVRESMIGSRFRSASRIFQLSCHLSANRSSFSWFYPLI